MRVISGEFGGRILKSLPGEVTRPTSDKVKGAIFNAIGQYFDGGICFDLYGGSGGLSIEAVSRGIDKAYIFEKDRTAQQIITANIAITRQEESFVLIKGDSQQLISRVSDQADLIFLDPPYAKQMIVSDVERIVKLNLYHNQTLVVCETDKKVMLPDRIGVFKRWKQLNYGITTITIYEVEND